MASGGESGDDSSGPLLHSIWKNLPRHILVERVLKWVPFASLVRFRTVCVEWNATITSPEFARDCQRQKFPKRVPILLRSYMWEGRSSIEIFDSESNSWLSRSLPLPEGVFHVTACSGGLICLAEADPRQFISGDPLSWRFIVCNPVTGRFRCLKIPRPPNGETHHELNHGHVITGLLVDHHAGTFKLIVINLAEEPERSTLLYDSTDGSWRSGAPVPQWKRSEAHRRHLFKRASALTLNGSIYCLVDGNYSKVDGQIRIPQNERHTLFYMVWKYNVATDSWCKVLLGTIESESKKFDLLEHHSQVLLVSRRSYPRIDLERDEYDMTSDFSFYRVREISAGHRITLVVDRSAFRAFEAFERADAVENYTNGDCMVGAGDVICTTRISDRGNRQMEVLKFNSSTQECCLLPSCPSSSNAWVAFTIRLLEPSLTIDL